MPHNASLGAERPECAARSERSGCLQLNMNLSPKAFPFLRGAETGHSSNVNSLQPLHLVALRMQSWQCERGARCGILEGAQKAGEQTLSQTPPNSSCQSSFPFNMPMSTGVMAESGWPSCAAIEPFRTTARARHENQSAPIILR